MAAILLDDVKKNAISLQEVVDNYDIVQVHEDFIVVAEKGKELATNQRADVDFSELGVSSTTSYSQYLREEYNAELRGILGIKKYDQMRRSDGQVRMSLRWAKTPVISARWYIEHASDSPQDKKIAKFVHHNLTKWMTCSWYQFLYETLLCLDFGWYCFEKVFDVRPDGKIYWRKFAPRHPLDLYEWKWDANGGPRGAQFYNSEGADDGVFIPIEKLLVFTFDKEGGSMEGISLLRSAYKHWYFKDNLYKIDAIQKERHGIGIPIIKLPPNPKAGEITKADEIGRNLRTNEKAHVVLPAMMELLFAKLEGQPTDCMPSIEHHNKMISHNILAELEGDKDDQIFLKGARFVAEIIRDVINKWAIPELVNYNWRSVDEYPELRVRRIGDTIDYRAMSFAVRNLVGAGVLTPDDQLEAWFRDELDLPKADYLGKPPFDGPRTVQTKQMPGNTSGKPKQAPAGDMNIGPGSNGRNGRDGGSPG